MSEEYWIFTFGGNRIGKYVKIYGTYNDARIEMHERYGLKWAFQYPDEESAGVYEFELEELT